MNSDKILNFFTFFWLIIAIIVLVVASFILFASDLEGYKKVVSIALGILLDLISITIIIMLVSLKKDLIL